MSATNSGVTPEPGFTYVNQLLIYSRDKSKGPDGEVLGTGSNSVVMDMNTLAWVSKKKILGAKFSMTATIPIAKNSLTSDVTGRSVAGAAWPILIINHSFWVGMNRVSPSARSMVFSRPLVDSGTAQTITSAPATGPTRSLQDKHSI